MLPILQIAPDGNAWFPAEYQCFAITMRDSQSFIIKSLSTDPLNWAVLENVLSSKPYEGGAVT